MSVRGLIVGITLAYIVYKFILFRKENPNFKASESVLLVDIAGSLIAIVIGLLFGLVLMFIFNPGQAFQGFSIIIIGGFREIASLGDMIYFSVPIILTGLSVAFAFKTGLFNIGATGQLTMGAFTAVFIGVRWGVIGEFSPFLHWFVALSGAMIVGALWGAIPGILKAYRNVNEVVTSIMLNYVAMYLNSLLIISYIYNRDYARALDIKPTAVTPLMNLQYLFPNSSINGGIVVAIIVVIILSVILNKTTFGYELKAVGYNRDASKYAGMNAKRNIVYAMVISGAAAGLAGGLMYLVAGKYLQPVNMLIPEGFTGIAISLLGLNTPFGTLIAGLFYGSLQQGGFYLQLLSFTPEIIDIIIAVIIYASALGLFLQKFVIRTLKKREMLVAQGLIDIEKEKQKNNEGSDK
ncbi:MAG: ABC transporter permease [Candidatus Izimaplasma sp.]|nr:ABC transporter permease [Candidatus Izimaplasma bacterium]